MKQTKCDLEDRTETFARNVRDFIKLLPKGIANLEYSKQLIRSSASIGANYIEANEALSKKDFVMRVKIARKECKETRYWLRLLDLSENLLEEHKKLLTEVSELLNILSAICSKVSV